jgi:putative addiction module component (TIGR02574 family)
MTKAQILREVLELPTAERLDLAMTVWESLDPGPSEGPPLQTWHKAILDQRIAEDDANPESGAPWPEVKQRILASL